MIEQQFKNRLKKHFFYATAERMAIFQTLKDASMPCSISELVDKCRTFADRSTVYRTLELFEKLDITTRVGSGWKYKVELSDTFSPHHHHMTCTNCGSITSFKESALLDSELKKIERKHNFTSNTHSLELRGLCTDCC